MVARSSNSNNSCTVTHLCISLLHVLAQHYLGLGGVSCQIRLVSFCLPRHIDVAEVVNTLAL
jgi:hypothetical protein